MLYNYLINVVIIVVNYMPFTGVSHNKFFIFVLGCCRIVVGIVATDPVLNSRTSTEENPKSRSKYCLHEDDDDNDNDSESSIGKRII